jgi:hypothetical protein
MEFYQATFFFKGLGIFFSCTIKFRLSYSVKLLRIYCALLYFLPYSFSTSKESVRATSPLRYLIKHTRRLKAFHSYNGRLARELAPTASSASKLATVVIIVIHARMN